MEPKWGPLVLNANRANPSGLTPSFFKGSNPKASLVSAFPHVVVVSALGFEAVSEKGSPRSAVDPDVALAAIG